MKCQGTSVEAVDLQLATSRLPCCAELQVLATAWTAEAESVAAGNLQHAILRLILLRCLLCPASAQHHESMPYHAVSRVSSGCNDRVC